MEYMKNNQSTTSQYIGPEGDTVFTENMSNQNSTTSSYVGPSGDTVNTYSSTEGMTTMQPKTQPTSSYVGPAGDTVYVYNGKKQSSSPQKTVTATSYSNQYGGSATKVTGPQGNSAVIMNQGIPGNQIPPGDENLYILKSQVVPPVCPACPSNASCPRTEAPPPCPPCARCPEPSFECKKVPNYQSINESYLPRPVLNDFSSFGM
tara:strand:- start:17921 stop:18535 length:615 start_codon:yes stop_codon:yes gene_type:complete